MQGVQGCLLSRRHAGLDRAFSMRLLFPVLLREERFRQGFYPSGFQGFEAFLSLALQNQASRPRHLVDNTPASYRNCLQNGHLDA